MIPLPQIHEINQEQRKLQLKKKRERNRSAVAMAKNKERQMTEVAKAKARERNRTQGALKKARDRNKTEEAMKKARERNKTEEALKKARERNKTEEALKKAKERSLAARKSKKISKQFKGWTPIDGKSTAKKLILPNLTELCIDCGAKMFAWEKSRPKKPGKTFSLCCSYGAIKLAKFKDPSPKLRELFDKTSPQSTQFLANIRKYNGLVAMASKCITGKLTDFSKVKSSGPSIFKMSGQMYHLMPNLFPVEGKKSKFSQIYVYDNECEESELDNRLNM